MRTGVTIRKPRFMSLMRGPSLWIPPPKKSRISFAVSCRMRPTLEPPSASHIIAGNHGGSVMTQAPQLRPLGAALGSEALRIDLSKPLEDGIFSWIHGVIVEHPVLVFQY